jgi:hypothetical protein
LRYFLFILLLFAAGESHAQTLRGRITDGTSRKAIYPVTVVNLSTQLASFSDSAGRFSISAKRGDQVAFSYVGYKTVQKTMPAAVSSAEFDVVLFPLSYELDDYIFRPKYSGYQLDSMERRSTYARALAREKAPVMSPVSFLAEKINKNSRQTFRFQKNYAYWEDQKFVDSRYTSSLVQSLTGMTGDTLASFMNTHPIPYDFVRTASELELKMWIRDSYKSSVQRRRDSISTPVRAGN